MDLTLHYTSVSHSESVLAAINKMRARQALCDVALMVGGTRILAHEVILSAAVPLFYQLSQLCPGNMAAIPEYRLEDVDETAAMKVIEFCYTSTISVDGDSLWSILTAATKLGCKEVISICCELLVSTLDVTTCVQTYMKAFELKCDCLLMSAGQFIMENIEMVCSSSSVLSLTGENFAELMAAFTYSQPKEEILIKLGKCWLGQDPGNRRLFVHQLMPEFPDVAHKLLKYLNTELTFDKSQPAIRTSAETQCAEEAERLSQVSAENYSSSSHTDKEVPIHICVSCGEAFDCEWQVSQHHQVCSESAYAGVKVKDESAYSGVKVKDELICQVGFENVSARTKVKDELICQLDSKPDSARTKAKSKSLKTQLDARLSCNINETNYIGNVLSSKETKSFGCVTASDFGEHQIEYDVAKSCVSVKESVGLATSFQGLSQICDNLSSNCDTMTDLCNHADKSFDYSDELPEQRAIVSNGTTQLCDLVTKSCDYLDQSREHTAALCDRTAETCNHVTKSCDYSAQPHENTATLCNNQSQDCDKVAEVCIDSAQTHNNVNGLHTNNRQIRSNLSEFLHVKTQSSKLGNISCEVSQIPASEMLESCNDEIQSRSSDEFPLDSKILKYKEITDSHAFNTNSMDCNLGSGHRKKNLRSLRKDNSQYNSHQSNLPLKNSKRDKTLKIGQFNESSEMKFCGDELKDDLSNSRGFCQSLQEGDDNEGKGVQNVSNKVCPSFLSSSSVALPASQNSGVSDSNNNSINDDSKSGQAGCVRECGVQGVSVGSNTESDFSIGVGDKCYSHVNGGNNSDFSINANDNIRCSINANGKGDFSINSNNKGDFSINSNNKGDFSINSNNKGDFSINSNNKDDFSINANDKIEFSINANEKDDFSINSNTKGDFSLNSNYKEDFSNKTNNKKNSSINANSKDDISNVSNTLNDIKINSSTVHSFVAKSSSIVKLKAESCYDFAEEDDNFTDFGKDQITKKAAGMAGRKRPRKNTIYDSRVMGTAQGKLQNLGVARAKFSLLKFKCLICGRAFSERKSLSNHERLVHGPQQGVVEAGMYNHLPEDLSIVTREKEDKDVRDARNMTLSMESSKVNAHSGVSVAEKDINCDGDRMNFSGSLIDVNERRMGAEVDCASNVNSFTEWCLGAVFCHFCGAFHPRETVCPLFMAAYRSQQHGVGSRADAVEVGRATDHFTGSWVGEEGPLDMSKGSQDYQVPKKSGSSPKSDEDDDGDDDLPLDLSNMYTPHPSGHERHTNFWNLHLPPFITQMDVTSNFSTHVNSPLSSNKITQDFTLNRSDISRQQSSKISSYPIDSEDNMVTMYREHAGHSRKRAMPHRDFPCPMCGRVFTYKTALLNHMKAHSLSPCVYQCQLCQQLFPSSTDLRLHVCANGVEKPHKCIHCDQTFAKNIHLKRHLATHSGLRPYPCWVCGKRFSRSDHLKRHAQSLHADSRPHGCQTCGKEFVRKYELNKHMMVHFSSTASNSQE